MTEPTNGELERMINNLNDKMIEKHTTLDKKLDEKHLENRQLLSEIKSDVKDIKHDGNNIEERVIILESQKKAYYWLIATIWGALIILSPLIFIFIKTQIQNSVDVSVNNTFRELEERYNFAFPEP